jgi:hypothetical protein
MTTDPSVPAHADSILVNRFRVLGTTNDRAATKDEVVKMATNIARVENKRVYIVQVVGYVQPSRPPVEYHDNDQF